MTRRTKTAAAALVLAAAGLGTVAALAATGGTTDDGGVAAPRKVTYREGEWTIDLPDGWTRKVWTDRSDAKKAVRYEGPSGEYFIVAIDPLGSDYLGDAVWHYRADDGRFEVVAKLPGGEKVDDGRYDGMLIWRAGDEPVKVGGHVFYFPFGNAEANTIDAALFEEIAESIRVG